MFDHCYLLGDFLFILHNIFIYFSSLFLDLSAFIVIFHFYFIASLPRTIGMNVADTTIASEYCLCLSNELQSVPIRII